MENIGKVIADCYCNGFFGRVYDLVGSVIVGEGPEWVVVRKEDGRIDFANFQGFNKQELVDSWCNNSFEG